LDVAIAWLDAIAAAVKDLESTEKPVRGMREMLTLKHDQTIDWTLDNHWDDMMRLAAVFQGGQSTP